jgi:hypothetical protein
MMKRRGLDVREKRAAEVFSREKAEEKGLERGKSFSNQNTGSSKVAGSLEKKLSTYFGTHFPKCFNTLFRKIFSEAICQKSSKT